MSNVGIIWRRELGAIFGTPPAYFFLAVFLVFSGIFGAAATASFADASSRYMHHPQARELLHLQGMVVEPTLGAMAILLVFIVPLLTMRTFSEERKLGTAELLFTAPLTTLQLLLGKYLAVVTTLAVMLGLTLEFPLLWTAFSPEALDLGPIWAGYLGLLLAAGGFAALGMLASSLTESQLVAGVVGFLLCLGFWLIDIFGPAAGPTTRLVLEHLSILDHFQGLSRGLIDTQDLAFFGLFITFILFLTQRVLDSHRWR